MSECSYIHSVVQAEPCHACGWLPEGVSKFDVALRKLAEIGSSLCTYLPGAGNPNEWPTARCDCKRLPPLASILSKEYIQLGSFTSERTGCCEIRDAYNALSALKRAREVNV